MSRYIKLEDLQKFPIRIDHYDKVNGNEHFVYGVESVLEYAEYLPTVDVVEVRHGHWIEHTEKPDWLEDDVEVFYNCSECGTSHWSIAPPYCPECGAKMDGERKEE